MTGLHLTQIILDAPATFHWAHQRGFGQSQDYTVHAATRKAFGASAPQPWVLRPANGKMVVLGYASASHDELHDAVATVENDDLLRSAICDIKTKPMPSFPAHARLGFHVRVCPIARRRDQNGKPYEEDVAKGCPDRAAVYREWLAQKLDGAAIVHACSLTRFQLIRAHRHIDHTVRRIRGWYPDASLSGTLEVVDPALFQAKLAGGIGRHKSFGFGALLLHRG